MPRLPVVAFQPEVSHYDTTPGGRYLRDPAFKRIVDALESLVHHCQYTPSELREAAMLAAIHYEQTRVFSRFVVDPQDAGESSQ